MNLVMEDCITQYDRNPPEQDRPDFKGCLRQGNTKGELMYETDFVNYLSNYLYVLQTYPRYQHIK